MGDMHADPNAAKALDQMKKEFSAEIGLPEDYANRYDMEKIAKAVLAGTRIGGTMTRRLVEMGEKELINKKNE